MKDAFKGFVFPTEEEINEETRRAKLSIRGKEQWEKTVSDPERLANWRNKTVDNPLWHEKVAKANTTRSKSDKWRAGMERRTEKIRNSQEWKDNIGKKNKEMVKTEEWKKAYREGLKKRKLDPFKLSQGGKKSHSLEAERKRMISADLFPFRCPWGVFMTTREASRQSADLFGKHVRFVTISRRLRKLDKPDRNEGYNYLTWEEYDKLMVDK
jgi:hypothetical protein